VVTAVRRYLQAVQDELGDLAKCFGIAPFRNTLVRFLNERGASHFRPFRATEQSAAVYDPWFNVLYFDPTVAASGLVAVHEAVHFYDDWYDVTSQRLVAMEKLGYAAQELLTYLSSNLTAGHVEIGLGNVRRAKTKFAACEQWQSWWKSRTDPFKPTMVQRVYVAPVPGYPMVSRWREEASQFEWHYRRSSGKISFATFELLKGRLALKFDCECFRRYMERKLKEIPLFREGCCPFDCSDVPPAFGGTKR